MVQKITLFSSLFFYIILCSAPIFSQTNNLPYSRIGLGDLHSQTSIYQRNMGGIGVSLGMPSNLNLSNPALLTHNRLTVFDAAISYEQRYLATKEASEDYRAGNLNYLGFAFPIAKKISIGAGFQPYSTVNYIDLQREIIPETTTFLEYRYRGTGGITQVYGSIGYEPFKGFSVGAQINYNFGSIRNDSESLLDDGQSLYIIDVLNRTNFSDFSYRLGMVYRYELENGTGINLGITTDLATDLNTTRFQAIERKDAYREAVLTSDTLLYDTKSVLKLPAAYTFGISVSKTRHYAFAINLKQQKWSEYEGFTTENLGDLQEVRAGILWIPDANSVSSFFKRVTYQAGFYAIQTPILQGSTQIEDKGITAGISLPVSPTLSSFNLGINLGERGTTDANLIRERYFKISIGVSINDRWFRKRKIF